MGRKRKPEIDFTTNDSCLICEVKTDGSVLCDKCFTKAFRKRLKKIMQQDAQKEKE